MFHMLKMIFVDKVVFVLHIQFFVFLTLLVLNFPIIKDILKIKPKVLLFAIFLTLSALSPLFYLNVLGPRQMADQVGIAHKFLALEDFHYSHKFFYGPFYPYLLYLLFLVFGFNAALLDVLDFLCLFLACIVVFTLSYFLFSRKLKYSLLSLTLFIFLNYFAISPSRLSFDLTLVYGVQFFLILSIFFIILALVADKQKTYALTLQTILLASEIKFELLALLVVFVLGILFRKPAFSKMKELLPPFGLFLIFFPIPFYGYLYLVSGGYELDTSTIVPFLSLGDHVDLKNTWIGLNAFIYFWTRSEMLTFTVLMILSFFLGIVDRGNFKNLLLLLFAFSILSFLYLSSRNGYDSRYASFMFPIVAIISSFFPYSLQKWASKIKLKFGNYVASYIIILIILCIIPLVPQIFLGILNGGRKPVFFDDELDAADHITCDENTIIITTDTITEIKFSALTLCDVISLERLIIMSPEYSVLWEEYSKKYGAQDIGSPRRRVYEKGTYLEIKDIRGKILDKATEVLLNKKTFLLPLKKRNLFLDINKYHILHSCNEQCYKKMAKLIKRNFKLKALYANENITIYEIIS